jgi:SAM-dependent methyltransferase
VSDDRHDGALPDYVRANRALWDADATDFVAPGERAWAQEPSWGVWSVPEQELGLLPDDMRGMRAVELGCGTAYVSAWMARRGAEVSGIDNSERQLETARRLAREHGVELELVHGNAERTPWPDASFDFAVSEYGASIWADPYRWIPEAVRLLRPGGELVFLGNHPIAILTMDLASDAPLAGTLRNPYFGMHRVDWTEQDGSSGTVFNLPVSEWMRLFGDSDLEVVAYHELRAPSREGARFHVPAEWAYDYPSEQVWKLRKRR